MLIGLKSRRNRRLKSQKGMATSNICFLFNAFSNSGKAISIEQELHKQIEKRWPDAKFIKTKPDESFWCDLKNRLKGITIIIACGGDGTVHRAGNLAVKLNAVLGIIPIGSGNDFAHMMNIPKSLTDSLNHLQTSGNRSIDLIKISGDLQCYCLNTAGVGLDGLANHYTNIYKPKIGKAGYAAGALKAVFDSSEIDLSLCIDGKNRKEKLLMLTACNGSREGGNFRVAPNAEPDDGRIDLLMINPMSLPARLVALPLFMISSPDKFFNIERHQCKMLRISSKQPFYIHVDGEYSDIPLHNLRFQIIPSALHVIA